MGKKFKGPTGISFKRVDNATQIVLEVGWTRDDCNSQTFEWWEYFKEDYTKSGKAKKGDTQTISVTKNSTKATIKIPLSKYPHNQNKRLYKVEVKITEKKKGKSDKTETKEFDIKEPSKPKFPLTSSGALPEAPIGDTPNVAVYTWSPSSNSGHNVLTTYEYQVGEMANANISKIKDFDWNKYKVSSGSYLTNSSNSVAVQRINPVPSGGTLLQVIRVRAFGPQGSSSDWNNATMSYHVFGAPKKAEIRSYDVFETSTGYTATLNWNSDAKKFQNPIDQSSIQYNKVTPVVTKTEGDHTVRFDLSYPTSETGWQTVTAYTDSNHIDEYSFNIDGKLPDNQCLFVRVNNEHDSSATTTFGDWKCIYFVPKNVTSLGLQGKAGTLSKPNITSSSYTPENRTLSITVSNQASSVAHSYIAVYAKNINDESASDGICIGILPHGTSSGSFVVPERYIDPDLGGTDLIFGVRAYVADYFTPRQYVRDVYEIFSVAMISDMIWAEDSLVRPPSLNLTDAGDGIIFAEWDWNWPEANQAELSWSTDPYAWESTNAPDTYTVTANKTGKWRINGLDYGAKYYVRVRLIKATDDSTEYGLYSEQKDITLSAIAPPTPSLTAIPSIASIEGSYNLTWAYAAEDGSTQIQADIYELTTVNNESVYTLLTGTKSAQSAILYPSEVNWSTDSTHKIVVKTLSSFGIWSDFSNPIDVTVVEPLDVSITIPQEDSGFVTRSEVIDGVPQVNTYLLKFPFTVNISGGGDNGTTDLYIQRRGDNPIDRPDDSQDMGFDQETIFIASGITNGSITIDIDNPGLIGHFDAYGIYQMIARVQDQYGQVEESDPFIFIVDWDHKANMPSAEIVMDYYNGLALIRPEPFPKLDVYISDGEVVVAGDIVDPEIIGEMEFSFANHGDLIYSYNEDAIYDFYIEDGDLFAVNSQSGSYAVEGDTFDIYRLTADKPEKIVEGGQFGETYIDPYPTIGRFGGYRIVYISKYGDYITNDRMYAWEDYDYIDGATLDIWGALIDFNGEQVSIPFDLSIDHSWSKDFTETKYLGGSVQGDWNAGVSHTANISTNVAVQYDSDTYLALRRLGAYPGACHVRLPDGSSFLANINVSEKQEEKMINMIANFTLDITRVDSLTEELDGILYTEDLLEN